MWTSIILFLLCILFIGYIYLYDPKKLKDVERVLSINTPYIDKEEMPPKKRRRAKKLGERAKKLETEMSRSPKIIKGDDEEKSLEEPVAREPMGNKNEERCRKILEKIFEGKKFNTVRPSWLKNPSTGRNLELDIYNHELRLALEYDGSQHVGKSKFHKTQKEVVYQFVKDRYKDKRCKELGISLIRVPHYIRPEELERYIRESLEKLGKL